MVQSASGIDGASLGFAFSEIVEEDFKGCITVNVPIYDVFSSSTTDEEIYNQIITTDCLKRYSSLIFPIEINAIMKRLPKENFGLQNPEDI